MKKDMNNPKKISKEGQISPYTFSMKIDKQIKELNFLHQAVAILAGVENKKRVLNQIVNGACEILEADSAVLWSYDASRNFFHPKELVTKGINETKLNKIRKKNPDPSGTGTAFEVIHRKDGYLAEQDSSHKPSYSGLREELDVKSFQAIALKVENEPLGVLYVYYNQQRSFNKTDRSTLQAFSHHAAIAIKTAKLLQHLRSVNKIFKIIAGASVLQKLSFTLDKITEGTQQTLNCDVVTLYRYNQSKNSIVFPPTMRGVKNKKGVLKFGRVIQGSIIHKILELDDLHVAEDTLRDPIIRGAFINREKIKSSISIPLRVGNQKVGVMFLNFHDHRLFSKEELDIVRLFGRQAAIAIYNAQLYDEKIKTTTSLHALCEAGKIITSSLSIENTLRNIVKQASLITKCRSDIKPHLSYLALKEDNKLNFINSYPPKYISRLRKKISIIDLDGNELGIIGRAVKDGKAILENDVTLNRDYIKCIDKPLTLSELAVPIIYNDIVIGGFDVECSEKNAFNIEDQEAMGSLAAQAGIAIQKGSLYQKIQHEATQLTLVNKIAAKINSTLQESEIFKTLVNESAKIFKVDQCAIAIFDNRRKYGIVKEEYRKGGVSALSDRIPLENNLSIGIILKNKKPLGIEDAQHDHRLERVRDIMKRRHTQSIMIVPIIIKGEVIGTLGLDSISKRIFTEDEKELAETIAHHAAIAYQNARQYDELTRTQGLVAARTSLAWMGMASSTWSHAIINQAQSIIEQIDLLKNDLATTRTPAKHPGIFKRLSIIQDLALQIREKPITPPLSIEDVTTSITINELIQERIKQLWQNEPYRLMEIQTDLAPDEKTNVRVSPEWLRRALDILIDNAVDATDDKRNKKIIVSTSQEDTQIRIRVTDNGRGISKKISSLIFRNPIKKPKGKKGLGMGLLIAQAIVQTYRGEIGIESTGSTGTTVYICLPREI